MTSSLPSRSMSAMVGGLYTYARKVVESVDKSRCVLLRSASTHQHGGTTRTRRVLRISWPELRSIS